MPAEPRIVPVPCPFGLADSADAELLRSKWAHVQQDGYQALGDSLAMRERLLELARTVSPPDLEQPSAQPQ